MMTSEEIYRLVQSVGKADGVLVVPKTFVKMFGSMDTALFLSQLMQWDEETDDHHVVKSKTEWMEATYLKRHGIDKARKQLKEQGIIDTEILRVRNSPVVHIHLNTDVLIERMAEHHGIEIHQSKTTGDQSISPGENDQTYPIGNTIVSSIQSSSSPSEKKSVGQTLGKVMPDSQAERIRIAKEAGESVPAKKGERKRPRVVVHAKRRATDHSNMVAALGVAFRFPVEMSQKQRGRLRRLATRVLKSGYSQGLVRDVGELWWTTWPGNQGAGNVPKDDQFMERLEQERVRRSKHRVVRA
jgi:hypothetical protein